MTYSDGMEQAFEIANREGSMNGFKLDPARETTSVRLAMDSRWDTASTSNVGFGEVQVAGYPVAGRAQLTTVSFEGILI